MILRPPVLRRLWKEKKERKERKERTRSAEKGKGGSSYGHSASGALSCPI